jgi:thioredoxin-dependent peroxiredoxin
MDHHLPNYFHVAPDFQLQSQTGSKVSLKDYKEERIIFFFFGDHSSDEIGLAAAILQRDLATFNAFNASVIGISRTTSESNRVWARKTDLRYSATRIKRLQRFTEFQQRSQAVPAIGIYEVIVAPGGKLRLPRIAGTNIDGESTSHLACLQYLSSGTRLRPSC